MMVNGFKYFHPASVFAGGAFLALLLAGPALAAAPAKKWFLEVTIYPVDNRGGVHWNDPEKKRYLNHAFNTRSGCRARWRVFRKQCEGLIADNEDGGGFTRKFTGVCRRFQQQPEPVLKPYAEDDYSGSAALAELIKREQECAR